jgi:microcystin-dependent protein
MSSYLTTASASSTYQTIAGMSSYLTVASASSTYQPFVVGSIIQMAMATLPSGYLACDGGSYSTTTYSALSTFLNFTYGGTAPSGLFKTPDFRGMFLRGAGTNGIDNTYASATYGSLQTDGIRAHTHDIDFGYLTTASSGGSQNAYNSTSPNYNNPNTGSGRATGFTESNNNPYPDTRPGNFCVFYCIKY